MRSPTTPPIRRRHSPEQVARILTEYERGSATQRQIAARHGLSVSTLQNWLRRQGGRVPAPADEWIEVVAEAPAATGIYRIELPQGRALVLGAGWRSAEVRELVGVLGQP